MPCMAHAQVGRNTPVQAGRQGVLFSQIDLTARLDLPIHTGGNAFTRQVDFLLTDGMSWVWHFSLLTHHTRRIMPGRTLALLIAIPSLQRKPGAHPILEMIASRLYQDI